MSDIKGFYITLQKFFWAAESDKHNQIECSYLRLMGIKPDVERLLESYRLRVELEYLNKLQCDINKLLEVYLYEE